MIKVYIISGFLGSGKTTFIKHLLENVKFEKPMLLENEFGEVGVDSSFFDANLNIKEINNGCICCSMQGDFSKALEEIKQFDITDLLIEPSGVGKLSEILSTIEEDKDFQIVSHICIVDVKTCKKYHTNFKNYFDDQVINANTVVLSHLDVTCNDIILNSISLIKDINNNANILDVDFKQLKSQELLNKIISVDDINLEIIEDKHNHECCCKEIHHHDHHHEHECCHEDECCCQHEHHHHDPHPHHDHHHEHEFYCDDECCCEHEHTHHDHVHPHHEHECCNDDECCCKHDHHHHDHHHHEYHPHHHDHHHEHECCHEDECECELEHHHHEHECCHEHLHEDSPFNQVTIFTNKLFEKNEIENILSKLDENIIRCKGYVNSNTETIYFNYILNESNVYTGNKKEKGLIVVIGTEIDEDKIRNLFI